MLLQDQVQPDKIKLLTPQQVAALGPAKVAALADVCVEWGPFSDPDRTRALADLEPLALGRLLTQKRVEFDSGFWVNMSPFATRAAAENRIARPAQGGREGARRRRRAAEGQFAVSLGNFRTEAAAVAYAEELAPLGVNLAKVEPRAQPIAQTLARRARSAAVGGRASARTCTRNTPGSEIKITACERAT